MTILAEYIWLDGNITQQTRSKTRVLYGNVSNPGNRNAIENFPVWAFDGSSTEQAKGHFSDCLLIPKKVVRDPFRGEDAVFVLCEVEKAPGERHPSNRRRALCRIVEELPRTDPWFGFEQEYTLMTLSGRAPLAWLALARDDVGVPEAQGPYYCGVGANRAFGRKVMERHLELCLKAGLRIYGTNAEVMPGQWEFQTGPLPPLEAADTLWIARYILLRVGEELGVTVSFAPKPMAGDWNGAGCHTNFSTDGMRSSHNGIAHIRVACGKLEAAHAAHIAVYGEGNDKRLTGKHETAPIGEFRSGVGNRGASVRIPTPVETAGCGYLEDRRPAANMDPYLVCRAMLETICGNGFKG